MTEPAMGGRSEGKCEMTVPAMGGGTPTGASDGDNALPSATADGSAPTDANTDAGALTCLYIIALRALGVQRIGDEPDADDDERQAQ